MNTNNFALRFLKFFSPFEWFLLVTIVTLNILSPVVTNSMSLRDSLLSVECIMSVAGVINVVLVAKGHISNYLFGIIQSSLYVYCAWKGGLWGQSALFAFYFLPMQFVGFFQWKKNLKSEDSNEVQSKNLKLKQMLFVYSITIIAIIAVSFFLKIFNGNVPYLDAATTVLNIVAMLLMVKGYSDQWYIWILVNIVSVIMWFINFNNGQQGALIVGLMWFVYLLNAIHGLIVWKKSANRLEMDNLMVDDNKLE